MRRRLIVLTLSVTAGFLMLVGVITNSPPLFYMCTVMILTLVGLLVQALLATRGLRFERIAPGAIVAGELVVIRIRVWSQLRLRRPLLFIMDDLPQGLIENSDLRPLPVAPNFEEAVETKYEMRPQRRGIYRWNSIKVTSTDSLGIITRERMYKSDEMEVIIHPARIPFGVDMAALSGWGASQADQGKNRGSGMEPRGVREFAPGDSLRFVHWRSTARTGQIQVKEFETGFSTNLFVLMQLTEGSEFGVGAHTTLEAMCGHMVHLSDVMLNRGSTFRLSNIEPIGTSVANASDERHRQVCDQLAGAKADRNVPFASEIESVIRNLGQGCTAVVLLSADEIGLAEALRRLAAHVPVVALVYDATQYSNSKMQRQLAPAINADFLASISLPTVTIKIMGNPFTSDEKAA